MNEEDEEEEEGNVGKPREGVGKLVKANTHTHRVHQSLENVNNDNGMKSTKPPHWNFFFPPHFVVFEKMIWPPR